MGKLVVFFGGGGSVIIGGELVYRWEGWSIERVDGRLVASDGFYTHWPCLLPDRRGVVWDRPEVIPQEIHNAMELLEGVQ